MSLYRVTVEVELVVKADSEEEADRIARENVERETYDYCFSSDKITKKEDCPQEWLDCIPYGEDDERDCETILKEGE